MEFRIADTFTTSLGKLRGDEQKAVKTTAFDLQINPTGNGNSFHRLDKARDKNFWSVRVNGDIRLIVHKTNNSLLLCYADHHDKAYDWAERRKLETHPTTGAAQLIEIREKLTEIEVPVYKSNETKEKIQEKKLLFVNISDEEFLSYGVPVEWLDDVKNLDEDSLLILADKLPSEAAEALLEIATGGKPRINKPLTPIQSPFDHPDAQRRFRTMSNIEELKAALEFPWDKWTVFLHPEQRQWVERNYSGPARISGSAGTGKTIVALHRAVYLARNNPNSRVLLTTYSDILSISLHDKLLKLVTSEPKLAERIDVYSINSIGLRLAKMHGINSQIVSSQDITKFIRQSSDQVSNHKFTQNFLLAEWDQIVDTWQIETWDEYKNVARLGRKTRLPEVQREILWNIFEKVINKLQEEKLTTYSGLFNNLTKKLKALNKLPFDFAVIDESQDFNPSHLKFFHSLVSKNTNSLFFAGDLGQRIFQQPFSWLSLGIDIRGRSRTLRVNYRTSHQIRQQADRLLGPLTLDIDGNEEDRTDTVSIFNGPPPDILKTKDQNEEIRLIGDWIKNHNVSNGVLPHEFGVFVRSKLQLERAEKAVIHSGLKYKILDDQVNTSSDFVSISTMHLAKGLEFKAVAVLACDDEVLPLQERIELITDDSDLQEVYDTERHLLYVACTRARDYLIISGVEPISEFLDDLKIFN